MKAAIVIYCADHDPRLVPVRPHRRPRITSPRPWVDHFGIADYYALADVAVRIATGAATPQLADYFAGAWAISVGVPDLSLVVAPDAVPSAAKALMAMNELVGPADKGYTRLYIEDIFQETPHG